MDDHRLTLRSERLDWREVEGEIVLLDHEARSYLAVTGSAVALWPLLVAGTNREAMIGELLERFDVDRSRAGRDVDAFLAKLAEHGLLDGSPGRQ